MTTILSKDIQSLVPTDKVNDSYTVKRKLLWGGDGVGNDITALTPLPVAGTFTVSPGPFPYPPGADAFVASYPDSVTEVYEYKSGGTSGTLIATLSVIYTDSSKLTILSGAWT